MVKARFALKSLTNIINKSNTPQEAFNNLKNTFKDLLTPVDQNPLSLKLVEIRAMRQAIGESKSDKDKK